MPHYATLRVQCESTLIDVILCDHNYVILRTNRARCALNKEILDLLNEDSVSGVRSSRASLRESTVSVRKGISRPLK